MIVGAARRAQRPLLAHGPTDREATLTDGSDGAANAGQGAGGPTCAVRWYGASLGPGSVVRLRALSGLSMAAHRSYRCVVRGFSVRSSLGSCSALSRGTTIVLTLITAGVGVPSTLTTDGRARTGLCFALDLLIYSHPPGASLRPSRRPARSRTAVMRARRLRDAGCSSGAPSRLAWLSEMHDYLVHDQELELSPR